jgi:hypothetical protein
MLVVRAKLPTKKKSPVDNIDRKCDISIIIFEI